MRILHANAFVNGRFAPDTELEARDGLISAVNGAAGEAALDLQGDYLLPGFVDVHIHAFMGMDAMQGEQAVRHMSRELRKVGVAAFLPTTMSASPADTRAALAGIRAVMERPEPDGAAVLGAHMEA
ncbi:MAG: amidohydrolase family protein, partial [Eubacteriales bacterium]|nr:amidohydrolase family protein [Eubacteriales bacterium]